MVFSSLLFTFIFLPLVVTIYYISKEKYRNYILLFFSLLFYSYGEPEFVFVMVVSIFMNYSLAYFIDKLKSKDRLDLAKIMLAVCISLNVGILYIYKYLDFTIGSLSVLLKKEFTLTGLSLPIGISFFTFQALSYVVDVYYSRIDVQRNIFDLALYISFFPQLIAGPIVRYSQIGEQLQHRICNANKFAEGFNRFMIGFSKKVLIANNLSVVVEEIVNRDAMTTNPLLLWIGSLSFSLQIYYDFSGYSDMAIGLGKVFGFDFPENFDYPYISKSVTEFWRRWHISLGQWFRDYVYFPLGGSRVKKLKHVINLLIVWLLTGVWHGAGYTFIAWGLMFFVLLVIEKYLIKPEKQGMFISVLWRIITLLSINFGWVIFNASGMKKGLLYCASMVGLGSSAFEINGDVIRYISNYGFFILTGVIFSTPLIKKINDRLSGTKFGALTETVNMCLNIFIFIWSVSYIILGTHNPFIYFNF